jgi:hypothetical protein
LLDEVFVVDLTVGVFSTFEDDFDFFNSQFFTKGGQNVSDFSAHDGTVTFLVEDTETFNEVLEGTFLLGFGDGLDVAQEFVEVAGLGVHFFLLWVTQNTGDILVGWLETKTTDEVTNLVVEKFAFTSSVVKVETVLDIFNLIFSKVNNFVLLVLFGPRECTLRTYI